MTTLKKLQTFIAENGGSVHTTTVARVLQQSYLYRRVTMRKPLLEKKNFDITTSFCQKTWETLKQSERRFYGLMRAKLSFCPSPVAHHPYSDVRWGWHHAVGILLCSTAWKACEGGE